MANNQLANTGQDLLILNQYPKQEYNNLIPISTIQQPSDMVKVVVNQVTIDLEKDTYIQQKAWKDRPEKRALTKSCLMKFMAAAGITLISSETVIPSTHKTAIAMAEAIKQPVAYDTRDVAHRVSIKVPDTSGGFRVVTETREMIAEQLKDDLSSDMFKQQMTHRNSLCETKALLRALRAALMIQSTYTPNELKKPFIVAITVPNADNPEIRKVLLDNYRRSSTKLFGNPENNSETLAITQENEVQEPVEIVRDETDAIDDLPDFLDGEYCEDCGQEILGNHKATTEEIVEASIKNMGHKACIKCMKDYINKNGGK